MKGLLIQGLLIPFAASTLVGAIHGVIRANSAINACPMTDSVQSSAITHAAALLDDLNISRKGFFANIL